MTIVEARYGGTYEPGAWLAFPVAPQNLPREWDGSDIAASTFYSITPRPYGAGSSPDEAYADLLSVVQELGLDPRANDFDWAAFTAERDRKTRQDSARRRDWESPMTKTSALRGPVGQIVAAHIDDLRAALSAHGITNARLFGSVDRGDDQEDSDVDLLVDVPPGTSLFDLVGIQAELQGLLGVSVDLGTEVKPRLRERINAEAVLLDDVVRPGVIPQ